MPRTLARRAVLGHACQSGNKAILLTLLFFVFKILFLPKYRVNYDYIIKWCFGILYRDLSIAIHITYQCIAIRDTYHDATRGASRYVNAA